MTKSQRNNIIYSAVLILAMVVVWLARDSKHTESQLQKVTLTGTTMGTSYQVKYLVVEPVDYKVAIDSLLEDFNQCLSTYIPESEISRFNRGTSHEFERPYFHQMLFQSRIIHKATDGAFDPTIMPLVSAWGFGPEKSQMPNQLQVDSLLRAVGFEYINFDEKEVIKLRPQSQLDFSAIAKGYAVDLVMQFLKQQGLKNIFVEIGGEISASGVNQENKPWAIFIEKPEDSNRSVQALVSLDNISIATSGNYRNFYIKDGKKYSHTISPFSGHPVQHSLLSVSVFAESCSVADAYATAFMVLGLNKALEITLADDQLEAYFIYSAANGQLQTTATPGIADLIIE
ncbi:MAG: FAD:protein FMN transferase [Cyclobacteriaceae bacterium]|nr:MAG: FAD:protein FMN transferase [Cyclobacteriaceae bacterium]